jgi:polyisoprenoid-binding protein YceI
MKKLNTLVVAMLVAGASMAQTNWAIDKTHSNIGFSVAHMVVSETTGNFKDFDAKVTSTADDFAGATVEFSAKTASVFTDNEKRDGHLKSDDFFNAEKFPDLKFSGSLVKEAGKYVLKGNLTIRDVTKPVTFAVTYGGRVKAFGGEKAGFKLNGKINRKEFGLKFDKALEGGGLIVGEEVEVNVKVEINKQA